MTQNTKLMSSGEGVKDGILQLIAMRLTCQTFTKLPDIFTNSVLTLHAIWYPTCMYSIQTVSPAQLESTTNLAHAAPRSPRSLASSPFSGVLPVLWRPPCSLASFPFSDVLWCSLCPSVFSLFSGTLPIHWCSPESLHAHLSSPREFLPSCAGLWLGQRTGKMRRTGNKDTRENRKNGDNGRRSWKTGRTMRMPENEENTGEREELGEKKYMAT